MFYDGRGGARKSRNVLKLLRTENTDNIVEENNKLAEVEVKTGCKNCPEKIHPICIVLAIIAWIAILVGVVAFIMWVGWVTVFWLVVIALCIAFGKCAGDADEWHRSITKR